MGQVVRVSEQFSDHQFSRYSMNTVELPTKFNIFGPPILAGSTFFLQKVNLSDNTDYAIFKIIFPSAVVLTATKYAVIINKYHNLFNGAYVLVLIGVY